MIRRTTAPQPPVLRAWHGSRRWDGSPELRAGKAGRAEWGAGIYASTHYDTALTYAKGGGVVRLLEFRPALFLEQAALSLAVVADFVRATVPKRLQGDMLSRLETCAQRNLLGHRVLSGVGPHVHAEVLRNLLVNDELSAGKKGVALAEFYVSQGIDAACDRARGQDYWTVVFNPRCIEGWEPVSRRDVAPEQWELDSPLLQQAEAIRTLTLELANGTTQQVPVESLADAGRLFRTLCTEAESGALPRGWLGTLALEGDGSIWAGSVKVVAAPPNEIEHDHAYPAPGL
ncbi:hypothetical protein [Geopseudomonas aromaticivorans]